MILVTSIEPFDNFTRTLSTTLIEGLSQELAGRPPGKAILLATL